MTQTQSTYILFFLLLLGHMAVGQVCPQEHYEFNNQASIDSFASANNGCSVILGNVIISESGAGAIQHLQGLSGLQVIRGRLEVYDNSLLKSMVGLHFLDSIYKGVYLNWLNDLQDIDAISQIPYIGNELLISDCSALETMELFSNLTSLQSIYLNNITIRDMSAFAVLESVGDLSIIDCDSLINLNGLQQLKSVSEVQIRDNQQLTNLEGLGGLQSVNRLYISSNAVINSLDGLYGLDTLNESFTISNNPMLVSLQGLEPEQFYSLQGISIFNNPLLSWCENDFICSAIQQPNTNFDVYLNADGCMSFFELASGCNTGCPYNISFRSQHDVDVFSTLFPQCHDVLGNVSVIDRAASPILNIDSLYTLRSIGGKLEIKNNPRLRHIHGLSQLESLGGDLQIIDNDSIHNLLGLEGLLELQSLEIKGNARLQDLQGLNHVKKSHSIYLDQIQRLSGVDSLRHVEGDFVVEGMKLKSVSGPDVLEIVTGILKIHNADSLSGLSGLEQLKHVGGLEIRNTGIRNMEGLSELMRIENHLTIAQNDSLLSFFGMKPLTSIGGHIDILQNKSLEDLSVLQGIRVIHGDLLLRGNAALPDIDELTDLEMIEGMCIISSNTMLTHLGGLYNLQSVGGNLIINNSNLQHIQDLVRLRKVGGDLKITSGGNLTDISGFVTLDSVYGQLHLIGTGVDTLDGWHQLRYVGGGIEIRNNSKLLAISGMDALRHVGGIWVDENRSMQHMDGLRGLEEVWGDLRMNANHRLKRLPAWSSLTSIGGDLIIERSADLTSLIGLDSLISIQGQLLFYALGLDSLTGLNRLESCGGGLTLRYLNRLKDVEPLMKLSALQGPLRILDNSDLNNIYGLQNLDPDKIYAAPGGTEVSITNNLSLGHCAIEPLCTMLEASGRTFLIENNSLGCQNPFDVRTQCPLSYGCLSSGITFRRQSQIDSFKIMNPGCSFLQGDVFIQEAISGDIAHLDSLNGIEAIGGNLRISENAQLGNLQGLESLNRIGGGVRISKNDLLTNIDGLNQVDPFFLTSTRKFAEDLWLTQNKMLSECTSDFICTILTNPEAIYLIQGNALGCSNTDAVRMRCEFPTQCFLDTITHQSVIDEFPELYPYCTELIGDLIVRPANQSSTYVSNLDGLYQLTAIRGNIEIYQAENLVDLNGLEQVTTIDGSIVLFGNPILESIEGLRNIDPESVRPVLGNTLTIVQNPLISDCAMESICQILQQNESTSTIDSNSAGCNNIDDVLSSCIVKVPVVHGVEPIQVYPNPSKGDFTLIFPDGVGDMLSPIRVFNSAGVQVHTLDLQVPIHMEGLPAGMYTFVIQSKNLQMYVARILVLP